ncbi:MAG: metal ABC transporter substrate-binding protein [bacterium]|nr:metal ABC transporter substrate-binding protein [bacterium]
MKRFSIITTLSLLIVMAGCNKSDRSVDLGQIDVLCTFLPVYVMTRNVTVGAQHLAVHSLLPASLGCPHNYALTPVDAASLEKADVLVMNGLNMEAFLETSLYLQRKDLTIIRAGDAVEAIEITGTDEHGEHEHLPSAQGRLLNPHAWGSPFAAAKMTRYIGVKLGEALPDQAELFKSNAERYAVRLDSLGALIKDLIVKAANRRIVTQHEAFDYLSRDMELDIVGLIEPEPGAEPSARYLAELAQRIRDLKPIGIFIEPQYSDRLGKMLSEESGVALYSLDPAASGSDDLDSYIRIMSGNIETLKKAMAASAN